jgi:amino acid transporter
VSVTAGIQAIVAFVPALDEHRVGASVVAIVLLMLVNLRGVRDAGAAFVVPTYLFIGSLGLLVVLGLARVAFGDAPPAVHPPPVAVEGLTVFLVLRAFAGGCTAMTGVEAIANGVPAFEKPAERNAAATLTILAVILGGLFLGVAVLGRVIGAVPSDQRNVVAQIGETFAGGTPLYYAVQSSAAAVLLLAANTSFNGFPRLAAVMAEDDYFPHQFSHRGQRLAYSNGIAVIGVLAIVLVIAFRGSTHALIPLFAVGVFLCFTLSQGGMVAHWWRSRDTGWRWKLAVNGGGALVTAAVTLVVLGTKLTQGAWIVLLLVPLIVLNVNAIHRHYRAARRSLFVARARITRQQQHCILVPVAAMNRAVEAALEYACSMSTDVTAVHIAVDDEVACRFREAWSDWAPEVPLTVVASPYREVIAPLIELVERTKRATGDAPVTVVLPEVFPDHLWQQPLHNQLGLAIELALLGRPGVVVTSVPVRLRI